MSDPRFEYSNDTGSYADYTAILTPEEFRVLNDKYKPAVDDLVSWSKRMLAEMSILDNVADMVSEHDRIRVVVFEWESGLGD
jgi:hypothetical protein